MANYTVTASGVLASAYAKRLTANNAYTVIDGIAVPTTLLAGCTITAGQPVARGSDEYVYLADATRITTQTSGSLVVGRRYIITTFIAGDSFTNVGAASNETGVVFVATGTTPTTWTNLSVLDDADAIYKVEGIAENGASRGQAISVVKEDPMFTPGCVVAVGDMGILSADIGRIGVAGDLAPGMYNSVLWNAWSLSQVNLKIIRADAVRV